MPCTRTSRLLTATALSLAACSAPPGTVQGQADAREASPDAHGDASDAGGDANQGRADIAVDMLRARIDLSIANESFSSDSCELDPSEQCVSAAGVRRILRFSVETANLGDADLVIGDPANNPNYTFSACHQHYHFSGYAQYRLLDASGAEVLIGRKQAFCLVDSEPYVAGANPTPRYTCFDQGLQAGWVDAYSANLPCQLLDVTGLTDGDYQLEVTANPDGLLDDSSLQNNLGTIDITLGDPDLESPTETCEALPSRYLDRLERECDWQLDSEHDCSPGSPVSVGCSQSCNLGACTGDPMIRVCDAETANCTSALALASNDNRCGGVCPMANNFLCPPSGRLAVYTGSSDHGQAYTCSIALSPSGG